jgi:hypothetical protein
MFGVLEGVQLGGKISFCGIGKGQATALRGCRRGLGGFAFLYRISAPFNLVAGYRTSLEAAYEEAVDRSAGDRARPSDRSAAAGL